MARATKEEEKCDASKLRWSNVDAEARRRRRPGCVVDHAAVAPERSRPAGGIKVLVREVQLLAAVNGRTQRRAAIDRIAVRLPRKIRLPPARERGFLNCSYLVAGSIKTPSS